MSEKKTVLVACGTGIATSTAVAAKLREALERRGISARFEQCSTQEIKGRVADIRPDIVVSTGPVGISFDVPVINGIAFLTGVGEAEVLRVVLDTLESSDRE